MFSSRPKPKRPLAISDAVRSGAGLPDSKRPKFDVRNPNELAPDAPDEEDVFLEIDEGAIGKRKSNRNKVDIEGYESDSSEEGFDATHKTWRKDEPKTDKMADEGDDMFADFKSDEEDYDNKEGDSGKGRKKDVKFMDLGQIEGQDFESKREFVDIIDEDKGRGEGEEDSDDQDEQEIDPEIGAGGKKKGAPKIDAFNMQNEMDEGRFDEAGNFIRKAAEKDAAHDSWLEGVSRKDMRRAKEAMEKREAEKRVKMKEDDAVPTSQVLADLIPCLEKGETILEALARLGTARKRKKNQINKNSWRQKKKAAANSEEMEVDKGKDPIDPIEARRKERVEQITGAADRLLTRGQPEIYDESRESLMRQYRQETGEDWAESRAPVTEDTTEKQWEFRWTDGRDGGDTHGPYDKSAMASWNQHGFFDQGAEFREVGGNWTLVSDFD
ncbi:unnamed protein product [Tuber melanosporum]|uniref:(Perigord truffle) hypothetical protein n=1 Tax=Tuber melanosporum (strain Mel28) TaxID=656061 RepID=D5GAU7_TUBMM|nr:uncharacterized protein GSTUM_00005313001 [Tuber melanosporum]CAZ81640.1 unnamed protein product [Tuber melanosporum]